MLWIFCLLCLALSGVTEVSAFYTAQACNYSAQCVPLGENNVCLGSTLKYSHTSVDLVDISSSVEVQRDNLSQWLGLQGIPRCWDILQPLLCAVYMPKCEDSYIEMYRRDLCEKTKDACNVAPELIGGPWPWFLDCGQPYFSSDESCTVWICYTLSLGLLAKIFILRGNTRYSL